MRIVLTGGGTQGHVIPFEPIIEALRLRYMEVQASVPARLEPGKLEISFMGVADAKTKEFLAHYDVPATHIPSGKMRRYFSLLNVVDIVGRLPLGILLALIKLFPLMPDVVISKGGYGSVPVALVAAFYRIPIILHESDAVPGRANGFLMKFAAAITLGFAAAKEQIPKKFHYKTIVTGTPVRLSLRVLEVAEGRRSLHIAPEEKVLLVMGGSQGAQQINEALLQLLPRLIQDFTVIHQTGEKHFASISAVAKELLAQSARKDAYRPYAYISSEMAAILASSDGIVSRAGSTIVELLAVRRPMLLIPLAGSASDHQRANARILEAAGAAMVLEPENLGVHLFEQNIRQLMSDDTLRKNMMANMAALDYPQAGVEMASLTFSLAKGLEPGTVAT
ncbi:MAG: UDP-N-acetylglucosamine--N-acetylmuramyl-(pentapeptide) pyrophosphoryl-undecaprenol N-acetylglucosamine transferase [Candidatus Andersenbacteria bacterium]|nr:UDP-N-acetylglucosamine--N-acetylmuramyl-(pentapeptide) pyrophosphoryl-undecaprenol N-acetylglucosamine transferase [Candidatus Andersenbacteria bacterium]